MMAALRPCKAADLCFMAIRIFRRNGPTSRAYCVLLSHYPQRVCALPLSNRFYDR